MPAFSRAVFLGLQAAALVSLVGQPFAPSVALAAPLPMPLMPHLADYAAQPPARTNATMVHHSENSALAGREDVAVVPHTTSPVVPRENDVNTNILNNVNILNNWFDTMQSHSANLRQFLLWLVARISSLIMRYRAARVAGIYPPRRRGLPYRDCLRGYFLPGRSARIPKRSGSAWRRQRPGELRPLQ